MGTQLWVSRILTWSSDRWLHPTSTTVHSELAFSNEFCVFPQQENWYHLLVDGVTACTILNFTVNPPDPTELAQIDSRVGLSTGLAGAMFPAVCSANLSCKSLSMAHPRKHVLLDQPFSVLQ